MAENDKDRIYLWLDLETTGDRLFEDRDGDASLILEVGWFITDSKLQMIHEGDSKVVRQVTPRWRDRITEPVVQEMHEKSGLMAEVPKANLYIDDVERMIIGHLHTVDPNMDFDWVLAGSGVASFDFQFLKRDMRHLMNLLKYFVLDIGQVRRFLKLIGIKVDLDPTKVRLDAAIAHRSRQDAFSHLEETRAYAEALEKLANPAEMETWASWAAGSTSLPTQPVPTTFWFTGPNAPEFYEAVDGWRWHVEADNGKIVDASSEAFTDKRTAIENYRIGHSTWTSFDPYGTNATPTYGWKGTPWPKPLGAMADAVAKVNEANGWYEDDRRFGEDIALLHSEVSEALEEYREHGLARRYGTKNADGEKFDFDTVEPGYPAGAKPLGVASELADVLIRLLDTAKRYNVDLDAEFAAKLAYNATRGHKHGGKLL